MALAGRPAPPTPTPTAGTLDQRLSQLAIAVSRKADITSMPVYHAVRLIAADGSTWQLTVNASGQLATELVTRT